MNEQEKNAEERREKKQRKKERKTEPREPKRKQTKTEAEGKSSIDQPARHRHPLRLQQRMKQVKVTLLPSLANLITLALLQACVKNSRLPPTVASPVSQ
jgi:hypothetical protein